ERRLWLRPASPRFPSVEAVGLCGTGTAERARHVRAGGWYAVADAAVSQEYAGGGARRPPGGRHGARASGPPGGLRRQPGRQRGWRELDRRRAERPDDRRAAPDRTHGFTWRASAHVPHRPQRTADGGGAHHRREAFAVPHRGGRRTALRARLRY